MEQNLRSTSGEDPEEIPTEWLQERLRKYRNRRLAQSDWTQAADSPLSDAKKQEWAEYRETLRNLPQTWTPNETVTFPDEPT